MHYNAIGPIAPAAISFQNISNISNMDQNQNLSHKDMMDNLSTFINNLEKTSIKFLYYNASDLSKPKVRDVFSKWKLDNQHLYIIPGASRNYCYVYQESPLKLLIEYDHGPNAAPNIANVGAPLKSAYDVKVKGETFDGINPYSVNIGNHVDYCFKRQRDNDPLFETHKTSYSGWDQEEASRSTKECNFKLSTFLHVNSLSTFRDITCLNEVPQKRCRDIYDPLELNAIFQLTRICIGITQNIYHAGKPYKCRKDKKGKSYIMCNRKKVYLTHITKPIKQSGGGMSYKGLTFFSDSVLTFIQKTFFYKIVQSRIDINSIKIIYDEMNELHVNGNQHVVFLYEYADLKSFNLFFIDMKTLLTATYADANSKENLQPLETQCLKSLKNWMVNENIVSLLVQ